MDFLSLQWSIFAYYHTPLKEFHLSCPQHPSPFGLSFPVLSSTVLSIRYFILILSSCISSLFWSFSLYIPLTFLRSPPPTSPSRFLIPLKITINPTNIHKHESHSSLKLMKLCFNSELLFGFSLRMNVPNIWIETEEKPNISCLFLPINSKFHPLLRFDL